ncbi:hypothetical protein OG828_11310 [Streptomyces sp. NBC_00457]|uniref:hypothetical protein n=1 Tax=Streptomyces sp. NBC_00457 TaxID=2975748 RepID=UPI002E22D237
MPYRAAHPGQGFPRISLARPATPTALGRLWQWMRRQQRAAAWQAIQSVSVVGAALALGEAFTAHADTAAPDATEAEKAPSTSPATSTSTGKRFPGRHE